MAGWASKGAGGRCGGFTLIELLIVLFLLLALFTWGMPDLRRMITNTHLAAISNSLLADLRQTQANAMTYGMAWLCPVTQGGQANGVCGTTWEDGWQVVRPKQGSETNPYTLLRVQDPLPKYTADNSPQITIEGNDHIKYGICFNNQGYPQQLTLGDPPNCSGPGNGTFSICRRDRTHGTKETCRYLVISNSGRLSISEEGQQ